MPCTPERAPARLLTILFALALACGVLGWPVAGSARTQDCRPHCDQRASTPAVVIEPFHQLDITDTSTGGTGRRASPSAPDVMALHSRPGSNHTIFLDFDGADLRSTQWASLTGTPADPRVPPADLDGIPGRSSGELALVELVWRQVAEDFAPFDVDVTTQQPPPDALTRSGSSDLRYGTTVVFSPNNWVRRWCDGCTGVAYTGIYSGSGTDPWRTALVFPDFLAEQKISTLGPDAIGRILGTTASHEVGHQLGLKHDGLTRESPRGALGYNPGTRPWGPIMGSTANVLTRWAGPATPYTNNPEDDVAVLGGQLGLVPDETPLLPLLVGTRVTGTISTSTDQDTYAVVALRKTQVVVGPQGSWGNLDVALDVVDATGRRITVAPQAREIDGRMIGMDASAWLAPGMSYTLTVRSDSTPSIGSYGSLGRYTLSLS